MLAPQTILVKPHCHVHLTHYITGKKQFILIWLWLLRSRPRKKSKIGFRFKISRIGYQYCYPCHQHSYPFTEAVLDSEKMTRKLYLKFFYASKFHNFTLNLEILFIFSDYILMRPLIIVIFQLFIIFILSC